MGFRQFSHSRVSRHPDRHEPNAPGSTAPRRIPSQTISRRGYVRLGSTIDALVRWFESYLRQHSLSPTTIRNYLADLRSFARWYRARHHNPTGLLIEDFKAYREYLCNESEHSTATVNRRLQSLRLFGRFLHETGHIGENPARHLELVHDVGGNGAAPRTLSRAEIDRLMDAIRQGRPSLVARDQAIVQLMLQAGLRVHEVAELRLRDVTEKQRGMSIDVNGRQNAMPRRIPLNASAAHALREYLATRPAIPHMENLFFSQRGRPLSMRSIQRVIDTHAQAAGLEHVCAQSLRHTCVRTMLTKTRDTARVARWLGQKSARGLDRYTK